MKKLPRFSAFAPQVVQNALNSKWLMGFAFACAAYYVLFLVSNLMQDSNIILTVALLLVHGFVTAEAMMLYQRKESRNLRHLSVFCLIGMIVMFLLCLFLGAVVISLNMEYSTKSEEIMQLWADAEISQGMPFMILTVVSAGITGFALLFLWKALGMSADLLERKGDAKNWFLPAAIFLGLGLILSLTMLVLQPGDWISNTVNAVLLIRDACLTGLMVQAAKEYREKAK